MIGKVRPIIIVGSPRSGTTLLYRILAMHRDLWHLESESHGILEGPLHPKYVGYESNRVTKGDQHTIDQIARQFYQQAFNLDLVYKNPYTVLATNTLRSRVLGRLKMKWAKLKCKSKKPAEIYFLEKTPKNSLRIPFLRQAFADVKFIYLKREPIANISSLINGWNGIDKIGPIKIGRFNRHGYEVLDQSNTKLPTTKWKFVLVPGWRDLRSVEEIATHQYMKSNEFILDDLNGHDNWVGLKYEDLIADPKGEVDKLLHFLGLDLNDEGVNRFINKMPRVNSLKNGKGTDRSIIEEQLKAYPSSSSVLTRMGYE